jgi:Na+/melibiose symporter-like transporter
MCDRLPLSVSCISRNFALALIQCGTFRSLLPACLCLVSSFANANVLLVLGEMMSRDGDNGGNPRLAIPLTAGAILTAQITMAAATVVGNKLTLRGMGRRPLFLVGLASLPVRCALIILLKDSGNAALLSTQIFDGIGGGFFGLIHPYLVADITFGTGRFNVLSKYFMCCCMAK